MKRYPETLGDFWPHCPPEFSKPSAIKTAQFMLDEYGVDIAYQRAMQHRSTHPPGSWGRKHWDIVIKWLEAQI